MSGKVTAGLAEGSGTTMYGKQLWWHKFAMAG